MHGIRESNKRDISWDAKPPKNLRPNYRKGEFMLDIAIKYKDTLTQKMLSTAFVEKYKFYNYGSYYSEFEVEKIMGWTLQQGVSVKDGEVLGYFSIGINRDSGKIDSLSAINFSDNKITFGTDLFNFIKKVFSREDINKMAFTVIVGNPIEKTYDKLVNKYGGRIVGVREKDVRLFDGKLYDIKMYEIMKENFLKKKVQNV